MRGGPETGRTLLPPLHVPGAVSRTSSIGSPSPSRRSDGSRRAADPRTSGASVEDAGSIVDHPLPDDLVELVARRFRALAEPTRIRLLDRLRHGEASVHELTELTGASQQNVSKHLGVLHLAGIVRRRKNGNFVYYSIADAGVLELCESVCGSVEEQLESLRLTVSRGGR